MSKAIQIILFIVIAAALIGGGVWYSHKLDAAAQKQAIADAQAAAAQTQANQAIDQFKQTGIKDAVVGTGLTVENGDTVTVNYTGTLTDGTKFDSSLDPGKSPFTFTVGATGTNAVIQGWEVGLIGMKVGGTRTLVIPPDLGYGAQGAGGGAIPPNATLDFTVQLLSVQKPSSTVSAASSTGQ